MAFCSACGTQIPAGARFCPKCGKPQVGIGQTNGGQQAGAGQPQMNRATGGSYSAPQAGGSYGMPQTGAGIGGIGSMFRNAFASVQGNAQNAAASSSATANIGALMASRIQNISEADLTAIVDDAVNNAVSNVGQGTLRKWVDAALPDGDEGLVRSGSEALKTAYDGFFHPLMQEIMATVDYTIYRTDLDRDPETYATRLADMFLERVLLENRERMRQQLSGEIRVEQLLRMLGVERFYSPRVIMYRLAQQYYHLHTIAQGIALYERQTIAAARPFAAQSAIAQIESEYGLVLGDQYDICHLFMRGTPAVRMFRTGEELHILVQDTSNVTMRADVVNIRPHIEYVYNLRDIAYYRQEGPIYLNNGATNLFASIAGINYMDPTRRVTPGLDNYCARICMTNNMTIDLTYECMDILRRLMPDKEFGRQ